MSAVCIFCQHEGATAQVGQGDVIGVAAHLECWAREVEE